MAYSAEVLSRARARLAMAKEDRESENRVSGQDYDEETDSYTEIFQYYIVSDNGAEILQEAEEIVYYNEELDMYVWGVTHWGTSWDYVMDALYDMAESVREKGYYSCMSDSDLLWMLVDKCLNSPLLEERLKNRHCISDMKKMRLQEEKESARIIIDEYNRKCDALLKYYNKHLGEPGFNEEVAKCTRDALHALEEKCPHLEVTGMRKSTIRLKTAKES